MSDPLTFRFSEKVRRQHLNLAFLCLKLYYISYNVICLSKGNEFFEFSCVVAVYRNLDNNIFEFNSTSPRRFGMFRRNYPFEVCLQRKNEVKDNS